MCDVYLHKCNHRGCNTEISMHLEDFATGREEVAVYCGSHIPKDVVGVLWYYSDKTCYDRGLVKRWKQAFVRPLTANAYEHQKGNHPNTWWVETSEIHQFRYKLMDKGIGNE